MGLFKSSVFSSISGSIGGTVYSRNRGGAYTRARTDPAQPNSVTQQAVRSALLGANSVWATCSNAQRDGWETYASSVSKINRLGETKQRTGREWCIRTNFFGQLCETPQTFLDAPIAATTAQLFVVVTPSFGGVNLVAASPPLLSISNQGSVKGNIFAFASAGMSAGAYSVHRPLRLAGRTYVDETSSITVEFNWSEAFPVFVGVRQVVRLVVLGDTGLVGPDFVTVVVPT